MDIAALIFPTTIPMLITGFFALIEQYTKFSEWKHSHRQIVIGLVFGLYAIFSTECGVAVNDGALMNVRDAGPLCAGFIFGGEAGIIAGTIGGLYRYLCIYWGGIQTTAFGCALSTFLAGIFSALIRWTLFEKKIPNALAGLGFGATMEVLHMLLVLVTNLRSVSQAFFYVQACTIPMVLCNAIAVFGAILLYKYLYAEKFYFDNRLHINQDFALKLMNTVIAAFIITCLFSYRIIYKITSKQHQMLRNVTLYIIAFMEILIFTALFILIYDLIKKKIIKNIKTINEYLTKITNGELDTTINVRNYAEFDELSNHINSTVETLKSYSDEIRQKVQQELEFASKIQYSLLPHHFPHRDDFELYASMNAAKVVGGDFYDFYMVDPFNLVFIIADASGKGVPAAMYTMTTKTMLRDLCERKHSIAKVMTRANNKLCANNDAEMFVTAWIGKLDLRTGRLEYCNAGHNLPILIQDGKADFLPSKPNFVLGGLPDLEYQKQEIMLKPGDMLYLYTDGVTEATADVDGEKVLFGDARLLQISKLLEKASPKEFIEAVSSEITEFAGDEPQSDDITMLSIRFNQTIDAEELIKTFELTRK